MPKPDGPQFVFHASQEEPSEFLKAPFLHVGTGTQAKIAHDRGYTDPEDEPFINKRDMPESGRYKLLVSKHSEIHPEVFSDPAVNTAQFELLKEKNLPIPDTIWQSAWGMSDLDPHPNYPENAQNRAQVDRAKEALSQNKIIQYNNTGEIPLSIGYNASKGAPKKPNISYIVPSPQLHLRRPGTRDRVKQPMLPLDYTGVLPQSERTRHFRESQK